MNIKQRVLYIQTQIAGLGIVVALVGYFKNAPFLIPLGIGIFTFGLIRRQFLKKTIDSFHEDDLSWPDPVEENHSSIEEDYDS